MAEIRPDHHSSEHVEEPALTPDDHKGGVGAGSPRGDGDGRIMASREAKLVALVAVVAVVLASYLLNPPRQPRLPRPARQAEACCEPPPRSQAAMAKRKQRPRIPSGKGLPILLLLHSASVPACAEMEQRAYPVSRMLRGRLQVVIVDVDAWPEEASRWRVRRVPTQVYLDAESKELARHEGLADTRQLLAQVKQRFNLKFL